MVTHFGGMYKVVISQYALSWLKSDGQNWELWLMITGAILCIAILDEFSNDEE